ncbi:MAG: SLBB domain-containing protein [Candidatus Alcyoniella australis]|nr:SLBB domain-containing protein [Candidatus Alcyoniella australis]
MRRTGLVISFFMLVLFCLTVVAQDYRVGPGDVLQIWIFNEEDLSRAYQVAPDGSIDFPLVGKLEAGGLTAEQIKLQLVESLGRDFLVNPQVEVQVKEYNSQKVYVLGAVAKPGYYEVRGETTILELIGRAGGVTELGGQNYVLLRTSGVRQTGPADAVPPDDAAVVDTVEPIIIDSTKLLDQGDVSLNLELRGGDILYVPKGEEVFVYGEVKTPGRVTWTDGLTVLRAVSLAGGPTQLAATKRVQIIRSEAGELRKYMVNLKDISRGKDPDFALIPDDVVVVPRSVL